MNIIEHSSLDPKTSVLVKVYKDAKPKPHLSKEGGASASSGGGSSSTSRKIFSETKFEGLEVWSLSDVVFLDDSPSILGRVVTVDQLQAIVDISHASSESGTMGSTSASQSTLKVFRLSEIESCLDSRLSSRNPAVTANKVSMLTASLGASSNSALTQDKGERSDQGAEENRDVCVVSQHIAGIVQHFPACLLAPFPSVVAAISSKNHHTSAMLLDGESGHNRSGCIYGYHALAMKITDNGPILLVKRVSDGNAFLACSGHLGFPSFSSSSFVSLSSHDSKFGRCTIAEESVSAVNGGYERMQHPQVSPSRQVMDPSSHPSILKLHKSQALMLQDANGHICSLSEGLRLKSPTLLTGKQNKEKALLPYKCVVTRTHLVNKDTTVMIIVAGKF